MRYEKKGSGSLYLTSSLMINEKKNTKEREVHKRIEYVFCLLSVHID